MEGTPDHIDSTVSIVAASGTAADKAPDMVPKREPEPHTEDRESAKVAVPVVERSSSGAAITVSNLHHNDSVDTTAAASGVGHDRQACKERKQEPEFNLQVKETASLESPIPERAGIFAAKIKELSELRKNQNQRSPESQCLSKGDSVVSSAKHDIPDPIDVHQVQGDTESVTRMKGISQSDEETTPSVHKPNASPRNDIPSSTFSQVKVTQSTNCEASDVKDREPARSIEESSQKRYKMEIEKDTDTRIIPSSESFDSSHVTAQSKQSVGNESQLKDTQVAQPAQEISEKTSDSSDDDEWHPGMESDADEMVETRIPEESDDELAESEMSMKQLESRYNQMCRSVQIPPVLSTPTPEHYRQQLTSRIDLSERLIWRPENSIDDTLLANYIQETLPTLRVGRTGFGLPTPKDLQITSVLASLTRNGCDLTKATEDIQNNAPRTVAWQNSDIVNFEIELVQHGKDFERFNIVGKGYKDIINFYFQWMRSPRCKHFVSTFIDVWYRSNCGPIHDCNEAINNWKREIGLSRVVAVLDRRKRGTRWEYKVRWEDSEIQTWEDKDSKELRGSEAYSRYKRGVRE